MQKRSMPLPRLWSRKRGIGHDTLAGLGHELRIPITSLRGYTEGLEDGVFQADAKYFP